MHQQSLGSIPCSLLSIRLRLALFRAPVSPPPATMDSVTEPPVKLLKLSAAACCGRRCAASDDGREPIQLMRARAVCLGASRAGLEPGRAYYLGDFFGTVNDLLMPEAGEGAYKTQWSLNGVRDHYQNTTEDLFIAYPKLSGRAGAGPTDNRCGLERQ